MTRTRKYLMLSIMSREVAELVHDHDKRDLTLWETYLCKDCVETERSILMFYPAPLQKGFNSKKECTNCKEIDDYIRQEMGR